MLIIIMKLTKFRKTILSNVAKSHKKMNCGRENEHEFVWYT